MNIRTVNWDRLCTSAPQDRQAAMDASARSDSRLTLDGPRPDVTQPEWTEPQPMQDFAPHLKCGGVDLTGAKIGRLTVKGYLGQGKWQCQCACGIYVARKSKAIRNPVNVGDRCRNCDYKLALQVRGKCKTEREFKRRKDELRRQG